MPNFNFGDLVEDWILIQKARSLVDRNYNI